MTTLTAEKIKDYALNLGYNKVGIISVDKLAGYYDILATRKNEYPFHYNLLAKQVTVEMPEAKSVIVLVMDYYQKEFPESLKKIIGKLYLSRFYMPPAGYIGNARLQLMKDFLTADGLAINSDIRLPGRWAAINAGLTTYGKNNFAYTEESGSFISISTILVDKVFDYDQPSKELTESKGIKCPENCKACVDACPTKALFAPNKLDAHKCIAFNHWTTQEGRENVTTFISLDVREGMVGRIHGCDVCQDACPRNQKKLKEYRQADAYIAKKAPEITLSAVLNMSEEYFQQTIRPIMFNYITDKRYLMRNAAIAMGSLKDEAFVGDLAVALDNPDPMVKEAVVWALTAIGGPKAKALLEK